jgi:hypothetical protein
MQAAVEKYDRMGGQIKTGSLCRFKRIAKYNCLLAIERGVGKKRRVIRRESFETKMASDFLETEIGYPPPPRAALPTQGYMSLSRPLSDPFRIINLESMQRFLH